MTRRFVLFLLFLVTFVLSCDDGSESPVEPSITESQPAWQWMSPRPTGAFLTGVAWVDPSTAVIVGSMGTIMKSTDAGASWSRVSSGTGVLLHAVSFRGPAGLIAGDDGVLLRSTDGGDHWTRVTTGTRNDLFGVCFADAHTIVGVGEYGKIVRINDSEWVHPSNASFETLFSTSFASSGVGLATGEYQNVLRSTDGGATWQSVEPIPGNFTESVTFVDAQTVVAVTRTGIMRSTDAGQTWTQVYEYSSRYLDSVAFSDALTGVAVGNQRVMRTMDAGASWTEISMPRKDFMSCVAFGDRDHGIAVGGDGVMFVTADGGLTWQEPWGADRVPRFRCVTFPAGETGFAAGTAGSAGIVYRSDDGGNTWKESERKDGYEFNAIAFAERRCGVVLGRSGGFTKILLTTDGGDSFESRFSGTDPLFSAAFASPSIAVAVGGTIVRSTDGGMTWNTLTQSSNTFLRDVDFADANVGVSVGSSRIIRTEDGGATWSPVPTSFHLELEAVDMVGATAFALGGQDIIRSEDGGRTWVQLAKLDPALISVSFSTPRDGYVVALPGRVFVTKDGGESWREEPGFTEERIADITGLESGSVLMVGSSGLIMKK